MKIVILGAGGLGSVIGAHLARAGEEVICIARGPRAAFVQEHGLCISGLANFTVPVTVITDTREVRDADVLMVTVKTYDTDSALASVRHLDVGNVLSLQNGVLKNERLADVFGREKVLGAATFVGGEVMPDGTVRFTLNDGFTVGELPTGTSERVQSLVATLNRAGILAEASPEIQSVEWSKYVVFVGSTSLAVLTRLEVFKYLKDADLALVWVRLIQETAALAARLGIPLEDRGPLPAKTLGHAPLAEAVTILQHVGAALEVQAPTLRASTLHDLERGHRLEVEETLGYAVRKGIELGIPLPTVDTCCRLMAGIDRYLQ
jgi:2-dehydropantoate 2-reductase